MERPFDLLLEDLCERLQQVHALSSFATFQHGYTDEQEKTLRHVRATVSNLVQDLEHAHQ